MCAIQLCIKKLSRDAELAFFGMDLLFIVVTVPMDIISYVSSRMTLCNHVPVCTCVITQKFKSLALLLIRSILCVEQCSATDCSLFFVLEFSNS